MSESPSHAGRPYAYVWSICLDRYRRAFPEIDWRPLPHIHKLTEELGNDTLEEGTDLLLFPVPVPTFNYMAVRGYLRAVDDLFTAQAARRYIPFALRLTVRDGQRFGWPEDFQTYALFARGAFREAGMPRDWDALRGLFENRSRRLANRIRVTFHGNADRAACLWTVFKSNGIDLRLGRKELLRDPQATAESYVLLRAFTQDYFNERGPAIIPHAAAKRTGTPKWSCYLGWAKTLMDLSTSFQRELWMAPLPTGPSGTQPVHVITGSMWGVPRFCRHPQLASKIIDGIHDPAFARLTDRDPGGGFPVLKSLYNDPECIRRKPLYRCVEQILKPGNFLLLDLYHHQIRSLDALVRSALQNRLTEDQFMLRLKLEEDVPLAKASNDRVRMAATFIKHNLGKIRDVSEVARSVGLSTNHLNRLFRSELGVPCAAFLRDQRLTQARDWLTHSRLSVKEIAARLGFQHTSSFTRAFQSRYRVPPTEWRNRPNLELAD